MKQTKRQVKPKYYFQFAEAATRKHTDLNLSKLARSQTERSKLTLRYSL